MAEEMVWKDTLLPGASRTPSFTPYPGSVPYGDVHNQTTMYRSDWVMGANGIPKISGSGDEPSTPAAYSALGGGGGSSAPASSGGSTAAASANVDSIQQAKFFGAEAGPSNPKPAGPILAVAAAAAKSPTPTAKQITVKKRRK